MNRPPLYRSLSCGYRLSPRPFGYGGIEVVVLIVEIYSEVGIQPESQSLGFGMFFFKIYSGSAWA